MLSNIPFNVYTTFFSALIHKWTFGLAHVLANLNSATANTGALLSFRILTSLPSDTQPEVRLTDLQKSCHWQLHG